SELTILGDTSLRDIHSREDLDPRHHLSSDLGTDEPLFGHAAVDPEANLEVVALGLEVYVAGAESRGPPHQLVQDDDRIPLDRGVTRIGRKERIAHERGESNIPLGRRRSLMLRKVAALVMVGLVWS